MVPAELDYSDAEAEGAKLGRCVCFTKEMFKRLANCDNYLTGYDEFWFSHEPPTEEIPLFDPDDSPYPVLIRAIYPAIHRERSFLPHGADVGHLQICDELIENETVDWFEQSSYVLGIGDGDGLICLYKEPLVLPWTGEPGSPPRPPTD